MSDAPTEAQVLEQSTWLENMPEEKAMRDRTDKFHELAFMELEQYVPKHVSRGSVREMPVADLLDMAYSIQAERHGYRTSVVLTALDGTPQGTVDRIEKAIAIKTSQHLQQWNVTDEAGFHQMLSYAGIITWCPEEFGGHSYSYIETPDPGTCYFPVKGAGRAAIFARRFSMLMRDVERDFSGKLRDGTRPYKKTDGTWAKCAIGDDRPSSGVTGTSLAGLAQEAEVIHLDDGEWVTYLVLNDAKAAVPNAGQIVYQDKNRAGPDSRGRPAAAALVVPGFVTPHRKPKHRLLPMFIKGIQCVHNINYLLTLLASKAENSTGDILLEQSADQIIAAKAAGRGGATVAQVEEGNPSIIELAGKPVVWERLPEPYLIKLVDFWTAKYESWSNSLKEIADPNLLAQINTNVYLPHAAARRKLLGPMLDHADAAMKELIRMDFFSLQWYAPTKRKPVKYIAQGNERVGETMRDLPRGEAVELTWDDVKDFDKRFVLSISTSSMTEEEQRQLIIDHKNKVLMGYATDFQGLRVAGYADEMAQAELLAEDEVYQEATQLTKPLLPQTIQEAIRTAGGIALEMTMNEPMAAGAAPGTPGTVQYMTPTVPGASGASEPAVA